MNFTSQNPVEVMQQLFAARDYARAKYVGEQILKADPNQPHALKMMGEITLMQGLWDEAAGFAERALAVHPGDARTVLLAARVAQARGDTKATCEYCDRALALQPGNPEVLVMKATALERAGDWRQAEPLLAPLVASGNVSPAAVHTWALILIRKGEHGAAVLALDLALSQLRQMPQVPGAVLARMLFTKAKALDRMGDYDGAFAAASEAKKAAAVPFDRNEFVARADAAIATFAPGRLATLPRATPTQTRHVFIAGMPRSGTTLVEQILDAHPDAVGVGEAKEIDILATRMQRMIGAERPYPACVADLTAEQVQQFRADYEAAQVRHFGAAAVYVNKNLENYQHLGLIAMLFPDAKVIVTRRSPRDLAVSCIMSNFKPEKHPYLSTQEDIALAYRQWERLIAHWRTAIDLPLFDVAYEDLVRNQDEQTRRLLEFVGLPWDDRCAKFWDSGRTVMTLSYDQVNRPMYDTSIDRWRNYEKNLGPFVQAFGPE
jgi:tetratricopeptide (TPR) repeat protein